jgi:hypothetical protein
LRESEKLENPPGFSVLIGGTAQDAAADMMKAYKDKRKHSRIHEMIKKTSTTSVLRIRQTGFDVVAAPTKRLPIMAGSSIRRGWSDLPTRIYSS